jgi:hypothetical protein
MPSDDGPYRPGFDPGEFRHAAARYVKYLIRARWKVEPGFLPPANLVAWGLQDIAADRNPAPELLDQAAVTLGEINTHYIHRCGSGGVREADESTPEGRLVYAIASLADIGNAGGPSHNGALVEASRHLQAGGKIDWASLVAWDTLAAIRADLDRLPHPQQVSDLPRLDRIEGLLTSLVDRERVRDFYSVEELAKILGKAEFTCREWCRLGRIRATKKNSGRGKHPAWVICHDELLRYRREGLLPR